MVHFVVVDRVGCVVGMVLGREQKEVWWVVEFCWTRLVAIGCLSWWHVARACIAGCLCVMYLSCQSKACSLAHHGLASRIRNNR